MFMTAQFYQLLFNMLLSLAKKFLLFLSVYGQDLLQISDPILYQQNLAHSGILERYADVDA